MVSSADYDTTRYFVEEEAGRAERAEREAAMAGERREQRAETEQFYLSKFREYILNSNRLARLQVHLHTRHRHVSDVCLMIRYSLTVNIKDLCCPNLFKNCQTSLTCLIGQMGYIS